LANGDRYGHTGTVILNGCVGGWLFISRQSWHKNRVYFLPSAFDPLGGYGSGFSPYRQVGQRQTVSHQRYLDPEERG
jgi:hypothetical protein